MKRMLFLICSVMMLLSLVNVAYAIVINASMAQEECNHEFVAYSTGSYRYLWYNKSTHKKYEIFMEVCPKCGYNYRESYAEVGENSHKSGNTYCSGGEHVNPGKHTFYKECTVCHGACSQSITLTCPGGNGYAHVSPP